MTKEITIKINGVEYKFAKEDVETPTQTKIKPGDIVRLASGGPLMTVSHYEKVDGLFNFRSLRCRCFIGEGSRHEDYYTVDSLVKIKDGPNHHNTRRIGWQFYDGMMFVFGIVGMAFIIFHGLISLGYIDKP